MLHALSGFMVVGAVIATGYVLGRTQTLSHDTARALSRVAVFVATPALLFSTLARADLSVVVSMPLLVTASSTAIVAAIAVALAIVFRWGRGNSIVIVLCSCYVNSGNLGIPMATYVLGDASLIAPVVLFQQLVLLPVALIFLDLSTARAGTSVPLRFLKAVANPIIIGSLAGVAVSASGLRLPDQVYAPFDLVGQLAVPGVLLAYGISLHGSRLTLRGPDASAVIVSVVLKSFVHPAVAGLLSVLVFHLEAEAAAAVIMAAALPAAQNLFAYANRYGTAAKIAQDSIALSTLLAAPILAILVIFVLP